jgi:dephospho-CoA kinase
MRIFGITGGIGAGKSEAARAFERRGIPVIDADSVGHAVIEPGGAAHDAVLRVFGNGILANDGSIDRARIAARAFADPDACRQLNAITHPAIYAEIARRCVELGEQGAQTVIVEAALLGERGTVNPMFEGLILVSCPVQERIRRITGPPRCMDRAEAERRIAAQSDPESKRPLAKWVIENGGDLENLQHQVGAIVAELRAPR